MSLPQAAPTPLSALRNAVRAYMRSQYSQNYPDSVLRGMVLAEVAETITGEFAAQDDLATATPMGLERARGTVETIRPATPNVPTIDGVPAPEPEQDDKPAEPECFECSMGRERSGRSCYACGSAWPEDAVLVREERNYGGCGVMGVLVRETRTGYTYTNSAGQTKRSVRRTRRRHSGERLPNPHIEPCGDCPERRDPRACIHGRVGFCETCMST